MKTNDLQKENLFRLQHTTGIETAFLFEIKFALLLSSVYYSENLNYFSLPIPAQVRTELYPTSHSGNNNHTLCTQIIPILNSQG